MADVCVCDIHEPCPLHEDAPDPLAEIKQRLDRLERQANIPKEGE